MFKKTKTLRRPLTAALLLCFAAVVLAGCGEHLASTDRMKEYAAEVANGEAIGSFEVISERRIHCVTKDRGIAFDVWTFGSEVQVDGSHVYYTSDYGIAADFEDGVYNLYRKDLEKLIEDCGLKPVVYSPQFDRLSEFTFAIEDNASEEQLGKVNAFLAGLRDIAAREKQAQYGNNIAFPCKVVWRAEDGFYYAAKGSDGVEQAIRADTPDEWLDVRNYVRSANHSDNVTAPDRNGVLLELKAQ